ncbi:DnaB-like helicase C-terminal domain-containing protein [Gluconobacter sp. Gdi]|uniref:replicative DNA helicase n=1 Tax=Gluconobacter sp. Gdi TaxID=2691888 RepID=UPI00175CE2D1|nr:DnaB-like helicase C-terminal domain-containing protein [Gluconobacter sp. Gdi]GFE96557.1 replicative DNA helicase [Gluconobacter sp. Gdi]
MSADLHGLQDLCTTYLRPLESIQAENAVLSSILLRNPDFDAIAEILRPEHFSALHRGEMYRLIGNAIQAGRRVDPVTMREAFSSNEALAAYGAQKAVLEAMNNGIPCPHALLRSYANEIVDLAMRRSLRSMARKVLNAENETEDDNASAIISRLQEQLQGLSAGVDGTRQAKTASQASHEVIGDLEVSWKAGTFLSGLDCGYAELNKRLRGLRPGGMYVLAGRPAMGKSSLALGIAVRMALQEGRGLYWSGEMDSKELMARAISAKCGLPLQTVLTGMIEGDNQPEKVSRHTLERIISAGMAARKIPLVIDDREGLSVQQIAIRARRMAREPDGLKFVVIDYIGLLRGSDAVRRSGNRVAEVTEISGEIARMARELKVPVIALSQLNRQSENREDRRPGMADIRDSGAIEQDARCILAVYREEAALRLRLGHDGQVVRNLNEGEQAYQKRAVEFEAALERSQGKGEVLILKNRGGTGGVIDMWFDGPATWFRDFSEDEKGLAW